MNSAVNNGLLPLDAKQRLLLAVSGGGDSLAMLKWFAEQKEWHDRIVCAHIDHMLQPESEKVGRLVRDFAGKLKVPFAMKRVDVPAHLTRKRESVEACARSLRYRALEELRTESCCDFILTAHSKDDDAETIWMKLEQGSSWFEVTGIPGRRERILRPFLSLDRRQLRAVLDTEDAWHNDPMNCDSRFPRVRARGAIAYFEQDRADVLDLLSKHGQAVRKLQTLSRRLLKANKNNSVKDILGHVEHLEDLPKNLYLEDLDFLAVETALEGLGKAQEFRLDGPLRRQCLEFIKSKGGESVLELGDGFSLNRTGRHLWVQRRLENDFTLGQSDSDFVWTPDALGKTTSGVCEINCREWNVRAWKPGETFCPAKRRTRKISDWLSEAGVHPSVRKQWPVLCCDDVIVAVPGLGVREDVQPRAQEPSLKISWRSILHCDQQVSG
ncbi:MAG: tRNA lysidine(34) synthetase TilS [Calditrichaeota bacterium]|nr:tRNA lysidine(34) synthetase TilS [Calditrichota bacterium]